MGGASSYLAILAIAGFMSATWLATYVSKKAGVSSIVLEITTGVILGPSVAGLIDPEYAECQHRHHRKCEAPPDLHNRVLNNLPLGGGLGEVANMEQYCPVADYDIVHNTRADHGHFYENPSAASGSTSGSSAGHRRLSSGSTTEYATYEECLVESCEAEVRHHCQLTPDFFTLVGHAGVALMIFESGMHFDFERARVVGPKACCVAVLGTLLPLITGTLLTVAYGKPLLPDGVSVGTALAPTSVGIALRLLGEAGVLQQDFGQAIITAAFVDDILSLVLFNILFSLKGDFDPVQVVVYPVLGVVFMIVAMLGAVYFWPWFISDKLMPRMPKSRSKISSEDQVLFVLMMLVLFSYATVTHFLGTHLWGCFIAGMSFACLNPPHHAHHVWVKQTKRATGWMIRIFFAGTVAFSIPIGNLLSVSAFWRGTIMGIGPCILTKVLCGPFMGSSRWVIGWAMVGRAEFAYLIAQMAAAASMIDDETFSIVIWALLYATIFAPLVFRSVLNRYIKAHPEEVFKDKHAGHKDEESQEVIKDEGQEAEDPRQEAKKEEPQAAAPVLNAEDEHPMVAVGAEDIDITVREAGPNEALAEETGMALKCAGKAVKASI